MLSPSVAVVSRTTVLCEAPHRTLHPGQAHPSHRASEWPRHRGSCHGHCGSCHGHCGGGHGYRTGWYGCWVSRCLLLLLLQKGDADPTAAEAAVAADAQSQKEPRPPRPAPPISGRGAGGDCCGGGHQVLLRGDKIKSRSEMTSTWMS